MTRWLRMPVFAAICLLVGFVPSLAEEAGPGGPRPMTVDELGAMERAGAPALSLED